jgi:hypothetical protein
MARFRAARRLRRRMYPFNRTPAEVALYYLIAIRAPRLLNTAVGIPVSDNLDSTTRPPIFGLLFAEGSDLFGPERDVHMASTICCGNEAAAFRPGAGNSE